MGLGYSCGKSEVNMISLNGLLKKDRQFDKPHVNYHQTAATANCLTTFRLPRDSFIIQCQIYFWYNGQIGNWKKNSF